ncbi:MAG: hypothetical protein H8E46_02755 [FCB group bacterium]|nr:hypothetical protein [FCB group bacterium]
MSEADIINYDPSQLDMFPEPGNDRSSPGEEAFELIRDNLVGVIDRMIREARQGSVPAAKMIFTIFPKLVKEMDDIDVWEKLREDDANR